ncbi:TolC family protein [Betaproteobacteria bacterium SCN2]|jgi:outer membrane protein TolC|nr:TolC family protein [Betaproteobacteria bacterium SCN2]
MSFSELAALLPRAACHAAAPALLVGVAATALADPLSFDDALVLALRNAPVLTAYAAQIDAARQSAIPAAELPDPRLTLGVESVPVEGPNRYSLTDEAMTMTRVGVMQEFPNLAKRKARAQAARWRVDVAEAELDLARLNVARGTAIAWIARHSIEHQLARLGELVNENRLFEAAVRARLAGGKGMTADIVMPRREAALIEDRLDELRASRSQAMASLRRWVGEAAEAPLQGDPPDWPIARDTLVQGLRRHPQLLAFDPKGKVLDAEIAEAQAEKRPDWAIELAYQKRGEQFGDMAMLQFSFDLPVFPGSRQDPMIAARLAERAGLDAEREAALREQAAALDSELADYERLGNVLRRQNEVLVPLAREKVDLAMADWRGGRGSLADLIAARRERIDAELKAIQLAGARLQMAARLHYSYAEQAGEQP